MTHVNKTTFEVTLTLTVEAEDRNTAIGIAVIAAVVPAAVKSVTFLKATATER